MAGEVGVGAGVAQAELVEEAAMAQQLATAIAPATEEIKNLRPLFDLKHTMRIPGPHANKYIKIPYTHIFTPELIVCPKTGVLKKWTGFHHDYMGRFERNGFVKVMNKKMGLAEIYIADIEVGGIIKCKKSFFPQSWSTEKVMGKIMESYENFLSRTSGNDGKYYIIGRTSEGIIIEIHMTSKGEILSAYPSIKHNWG